MIRLRHSVSKAARQVSNIAQTAVGATLGSSLLTRKVVAPLLATEVQSNVEKINDATILGGALVAGSVLAAPAAVPAQGAAVAAPSLHTAEQMIRDLGGGAAPKPAPISMPVPVPGTTAAPSITGAQWLSIAGLAVGVLSLLKG